MLYAPHLQLLQVPMTRLVTYGQRSFLYAAPTLWNSLPASLTAINSINDFKSRLKTYLFRSAFSKQNKISLETGLMDVIF